MHITGNVHVTYIKCQLQDNNTVAKKTGHCYDQKLSAVGG